MLFKHLLAPSGQKTIGNVPRGYDAWLIAALTREHQDRSLVIVRDARRLAEIKRALAFFGPDLVCLDFPAWDCLPYDRLSPQTGIMSNRMATLAALPQLAGKPHIVLTTVAAITQRVPSRAMVGTQSFSAKPGQVVDINKLVHYLVKSGFSRTSTVREPGEFAQRGGIIDIFPPGRSLPIRLDFFGDTLESIRLFDEETQKTVGTETQFDLIAAGEVHLDAVSIKRFRQGYIQTFGGGAISDPVYENVSSGARHQGMEHWLPLFHDKLETLFDHINPEALVFSDPQTGEAIDERWEQIEEYYQARLDALNNGNFLSTPIRPLPCDQLYLNRDEYNVISEALKLRILTPFAQSDERQNMDASLGYNFTAERAQDGINVFDALFERIQAIKRPVIIDCASEGASSRMAGLLKDHGIQRQKTIKDYLDLSSLNPGDVGFSVMGLEQGFETKDYVFIAEPDILGDRMVRATKRKKAENFLTEASTLNHGDIVVHVDHGIARFEGLETVDVTGAPHECLRLIYHDNARLFLPVENIDLLSRFGGDDANVTLDRLGGHAWQSRKAKLKERLNLIAGTLIRIAAERALHDAPKYEPIHGLYDEFCARFPYEETEDQIDSIEAVLDDLSRGRPMDRLICGDVGFGKTEVALRAAQVVAMAGGQVAIVAPTTLLARQHAKNFQARFSNLPIKVGTLSRLVDAKSAKETKEGLSNGQVDIVIGTHALLSKSIEFKRLGLVIVDEEQHFGVAHKERLKDLRSNVHVLTLTATPIPRTLQMALSGVRDLSLIATPPVDRLAIRTYITPHDGVILREALLREKYRAGQSFYIVPRISDLTEIEAFLSEYVPEVKFITAHGQLAGTDLEDRMTAFYEGQYDVLLSTSIIESGLDIPTANTMIIHRADMFGLAQLYQMRGRVGRSKQRAYAYMTYQENKPLTPAAQKRLQVLQSLDSLGAGFTLASHDLDMRGAGNLVGDEQSGHIREVGYELYQSMLEEAIADRQGISTNETWSPQINLGLSVMMNEDYIPDLELRMGLYRRLSLLDSDEQVEGFAAEMIDRFGPLPQEVQNLFSVVKLKIACYQAGIEKIDAGPKGASLTFRNNSFANPQGLVRFINDYQDRIKLRPDHTLFVAGQYEDLQNRLSGVNKVIAKLSDIATQNT
ncbi:transcription-repair coupling factor [Alphaproteobacteria bacterium]|nr:transcription-repair coupling factor [Alphaproteobacteria bacterium]